MQRHRAVIWILIITPDFFLKGKSAAQLHSVVLFLFFTPFFFSADRAGIVFGSDACVAALPQSQSELLLRGRCRGPLPPPTYSPPPPPPFHCLLLLFLYFASFLSHIDVRCWCGKHRLHSHWSSLENQGGSRRPLTQGSRWGVHWSWAPSPAPPWSESLAAAPHNPYSKGQLDWDHGAQGEQRDLTPPRPHPTPQ